MVPAQTENNRFIRHISIANLLSFGGDLEGVELLPLNVLIGPNGAGKSNLIEIFSLLRAAPTDLIGPVLDGGGIGEWLWKGRVQTPTAKIEIITSHPSARHLLRHRIEFTIVGQRFEILDEAIENAEKDADHYDDVRFYYRYRRGHPVISVRSTDDDGVSSGSERVLQREDLLPNQSVLSQRKDPDQFPEVTYLGRKYGQIKLFREWNLGRYTFPRKPQLADLPNDFLLEDASNLGLVLNNLEYQFGVKNKILDALRLFNESYTDYSTRIQGGTVQLYLHIRGLQQPIPATRLSDGTLRFLCLLAIFCHPDPPPLICLEEPELGLHPDILPTVAELLIEASKKTQIIVTTHSDILVEEFSDHPEFVVVCENVDQRTLLRRLSKDDLSTWLEKHSLGELWRQGEIGGNRW